MTMVATTPNPMTADALLNAPAWGGKFHPMGLRESMADDIASRLRQHLGPAANLVSDSRNLASGDGLMAREGKRHSLSQIIDSALTRGAKAIVIESATDSDELQVLPPETIAAAADVLVLGVPKLACRTGMIASAFYGRPSMTLPVIAVTGTNGKSTVSAALGYAIARLGEPSAVIGTLGLGRFPAKCAQGFQPTWDAKATGGLTTPDSVTLHRLLHELAQDGCRAVVLEASSIGLVQGRLQGLAVKTAAFTNLSHDHLDLHGTFENYCRAKAFLFEAPTLGTMVVNMDEAHGPAMWQAADRHVNRWAIGGHPPDDAHASLRAEAARLNHDGLQFELHAFGKAADLSGPIQLPVVGHHNIQNALVVASCLMSMKFDPALVREQLHEFQLPAGRLEMLKPDRAPWAVIDYAHTPDALAHVLKALREVALQREGQLICVFGCGGDRDRAKRPLMGQIAVHDADQVVLTSDNPRHEDAERIMDEIASGIPAALQTKVIRETDRALAIGRAFEVARASDIVLVAGKGHEKTQQIGDQNLMFSDRDHAAAAIDRWTRSQQHRQGVTTHA